MKYLCLYVGIIGQLLACNGTTDSDSAVDPDVSPLIDIQQDASDTRTQPSDSQSGTDPAPTPADSGPPVEELYVVGLNETGETSPKFFEPLKSGDQVPIELGPQGAWMIVAAVKTNGFPNDLKKAQVKASLITEEGTIFGKATFKKKAIFPSNDGFSYMMNIWLVVSSKTLPDSPIFVWQDQNAVLSIAIEGPDGKIMEDSLSVTMYKETVTGNQ